MNLAITTTSARTWKTVKAHYLVAMAGAALALSSVVGAASLSIDWGSSTSGVGRPVSPAVRSADQKYVTFYLVGSEAERDLLIAGYNEAALEREPHGGLDPNTSFSVFVARTPDEVGSAMLAIYEGMSSFNETNTSVRLIDLLPR